MIASGPRRAPRRGLLRALLAAALAFAVAPVALALAAAAARPAFAAGPARPLSQSLTGAAKQDYDTGKLLASDGDYAGAALKFQSAYDQSHDARLLWNVAFCEKQLRHYARVLALLHRFEAEGGSLLTAKDRHDARELASALQPFTTTVKIAVNEDGAEVFVDDERVGASPLAAPIVVDIGTHRFRATKPGFLDAASTSSIGGGVDLPIALKLERDVHEGRIVVHAPPGATIVLDEAPAGVERSDRVVASGGHQLRVEAPGMRAYRTEVVVGDRETRSLEVMLERLPDAELPRLRVAVGCVDPSPRSTADGLTVYVDGAANAAAPVETRAQKDFDRKRDVVAWVAFPITIGAHVVEVRAPGCSPAQLSVTVADERGANVAGTLAPQPEPLSGGTAGSPDGLRLAAGGWLGTLAVHDLFGDLFGGSLDRIPARPRDLGLAAAGATMEGGWTHRWATVAAQASAAWASTTGTTAAVTLEPGPIATFGSRSTATSIAFYRAGVRAGPRLPLGVAALSAGVAGAVGVETVAGRGGSGSTHTGVVGSVWAALDVKPLCDWTTTLGVQDDLAAATSNRAVGGMLLVGFEPNARCRHGGSTRYELQWGHP